MDKIAKEINEFSTRRMAMQKQRLPTTVPTRRIVTPEKHDMMDSVAQSILMDSADWTAGKTSREMIKLVEKRTVVDIHSAARERYKYVLVERDPITNLYIRERIEPDGTVVVEEVTSSLLNSEWTDTGQGPAHPFFTAEGGNIYETQYLHDDPGSYTIRLPVIFNHVKSVLMLSSQIPFSMNLIHAGINQLALNIYLDGERFELVEDADQINVEIPCGNYQYNLVNLLEILVASLNLAVSQQVVGWSQGDLFSYLYDSNTGKIELVANFGVSFDLTFLHADGIDETQCLWYIFGFDTRRTLEPVEVWSNWNSTELRPFRKPMIGVTGKTVYLAINNWSVIHLTESIGDPHHDFRHGYGGGGVDRAPIRGGRPPIFAKFVLDGEPDQILFNKHITTPLVFLESPLDELIELKIKWVDEWGNLIDFNGQDHSFSLEIVEIVSRLQGTGYSDQRGAYDFLSTTESLQISRN